MTSAALVLREWARRESLCVLEGPFGDDSIEVGAVPCLQSVTPEVCLAWVTHGKIFVYWLSDTLFGPEPVEESKLCRLHASEIWPFCQND